MQNSDRSCLAYLAEALCRRPHLWARFIGILRGAVSSLSPELKAAVDALEHELQQLQPTDVGGIRDVAASLQQALSVDAVTVGQVLFGAIEAHDAKAAR